MAGAALIVAVLSAVLSAALAAGAPAQELENGGGDGAVIEPGHGSSTNLPVPRYVSLKTSDGNVRRGPSLEHRVDWVFHHRDMPLRITAEFEHWRRVEDNEGQGGWIYYTMLSGVRTLLVTTDKAELHEAPDDKSPVVALAEEGAIGKLGSCKKDWCELSGAGADGWVKKSDVWGVDAGEERP